MKNREPMNATVMRLLRKIEKRLHCPDLRSGGGWKIHLLHRGSGRQPKSLHRCHARATIGV